MCHELILPLVAAWLSDLLLGDPRWLPHPVVGFGHMIARGERMLNRGSHRMAKGALMTILLDSIVFFSTFFLFRILHADALPHYVACVVSGILIFYCLAGTTLIREVREVFRAVDRSLDEGRRQVGRIVGRDTAQLSAQEVRTAALETLAENLSDGVVAPLFWLAVGGVPAMLTYKMINTQDSMIGYRNARYKDFGCWAARIDDVANYVPARLTAMLMVVLSGRWSLFSYVWKYGRCHASPNSGYPEAALSGILGCRFGGPHHYFGELVEKPYIGDRDRPLTSADMERSVRLSRSVEVVTIVTIISIYSLL